MAINSINKSPLFIPTSRISTPTPATAPAQQGSGGVQGGSQPNALQRRMMTDSFEGPGKMGGMQGMQAQMAQVAQMLGQIMQMLQSMSAQGKGGEAGAGAGDSMGPAAAAAPAASAPAAAAPAPAAAAAPAAAPAPAAAAPAPAAPAPQAAAPSKDVAKSEGAAAPSQNKSTSPGNSMNFTNDGTKPMTIKFTPNAGDKEVASVTLKPGESRNVDFPQGWSGNFRSTSGDGSAATLGEVKFDGGSDGKTFYDVSYIEGQNAAMTIAPENGGKKSGTMDNLLDSAPDSIKAKDASGKAYGIKKTTTSDVQDASVVDYYRQKVGTGDGYVVPKDDASTLGTSDKHLSVHIKDAT